MASRRPDHALVDHGKTQLPANRGTLHPAFGQSRCREQLLSRDGFYQELHEAAARTRAGLLNQGTGWDVGHLVTLTLGPSTVLPFGTATQCCKYGVIPSKLLRARTPKHNKFKCFSGLVAKQDSCYKDSLSGPCCSHHSFDLLPAEKGGWREAVIVAGRVEHGLRCHATAHASFLTHQTAASGTCRPVRQLCRGLSSWQHLSRRCCPLPLRSVCDNVSA